MRLKKFLATTLTCALTVATALGNVTNASAASLSDVDTPTFWAAHTKGVEIAEGTTVTITYKNTSNSSASSNWETALYVVFSGNNGVVGEAGDSGYTEYFVGRSDVYGWDPNGGNTADGLVNGSYTVNSAPEDDDAWAAWLKEMKSGVTCTVVASMSNSTITVVMTASNAKSTWTYKTDGSTTYIALGGENCKLTNISYTVSNGSSSSSEKEDTSLKKGDTFKVDGNTYKVTKAGSTVTCTKCTSSKIPATVKDSNKTSYKVTAIAAKAAKGNKKLKTVTIGSNVTSIGANAFSGCTKLTTVKITTTSKLTIGKAAFKGDKKLTKVSISSKSVSVGKKAFKGASSKAKVTMPLSAL